LAFAVVVVLIWSEGTRADATGILQRNRVVALLQDAKESLQLLDSVREQDHVAFDRLLDDSLAVDIDATTSQGVSLLELAVLSRDWYIAERLLHAGSHASIYALAGIGRTQDVKQLLSTDISRLNLQHGGWSLLQWAVMNGNVTTAALLLDLGADARTKGGLGATALHLAANAGAHGLIAPLIRAGADPVALDEAGNTPAAIAARDGHAEFLRRLIATGVDVQVVPRGGASPLLQAAAFGHADTLALLAPSWRSRMDLSEAMLVAAREGHALCVDLLLRSGVDANTSDREMSALQRAASEGHDGVIRVLLAHHATINDVDSRGQTALHMAAVRGSNKAAIALLEGGADERIKDYNGDEPADLAAAFGHKSLESLLRGWKSVTRARP
jgi:ankyrin repeat protein